MLFSDLALALFAIDAAILLLLLSGTVWSIVFPDRRIWPPPERRSWHNLITWVCFYAVFALNGLLMALDWNTWSFPSPSRFVLGAPLAASGAALVAWGLVTLGIRNTSGEGVGLVASGPYRVTRNPQYLGDALLFLGLSVIVNSLLLWIAHGLLTAVLLLAPLAEETWLEERYGSAYGAYRRNAPRYVRLGRSR